jgi:hypothetical protein
MHTLSTKTDLESVKRILVRNGIAPVKYREDVNYNCGGFDYVVISFLSLPQLIQAKELLK